jgi:hypothetical protein
VVEIDLPRPRDRRDARQRRFVEYRASCATYIAADMQSLQMIKDVV